ncbi:hypothetical protein TCON_2371 [Astathelohania contejeani]|uniref:Uncharacterized protein n=1 Tax=Astathelohania contejeani TaxID=164912 RepID=A0ABQ7HW93_9MICR|nr:hypothetical protein TCON_2371 [Thelohania contejeani]
MKTSKKKIIISKYLTMLMLFCRTCIAIRPLIALHDINIIEYSFFSGKAGDEKEESYILNKLNETKEILSNSNCAEKIYDSKSIIDLFKIQRNENFFIRNKIENNFRRFRIVMYYRIMKYYFSSMNPDYILTIVTIVDSKINNEWSYIDENKVLLISYFIIQLFNLYSKNKIYLLDSNKITDITQIAILITVHILEEIKNDIKNPEEVLKHNHLLFSKADSLNFVSEIRRFVINSEDRHKETIIHEFTFNDKISIFVNEIIKMLLNNIKNKKTIINFCVLNNCKVNNTENEDLKILNNIFHEIKVVKKFEFSYKLCIFSLLEIGRNDIMNLFRGNMVYKMHYLDAIETSFRNNVNDFNNILNNINILKGNISFIEYTLINMKTIPQLKTFNNFYQSLYKYFECSDSMSEKLFDILRNIFGDYDGNQDLLGLTNEELNQSMESNESSDRTSNDEMSNENDIPIKKNDELHNTRPSENNLHDIIFPTQNTELDIVDNNPDINEPSTITMHENIKEKINTNKNTDLQSIDNDPSISTDGDGIDEIIKNDTSYASSILDKDVKSDNIDISNGEDSYFNYNVLNDGSNKDELEDFNSHNNCEQYCTNNKSPNKIFLNMGRIAITVSAIFKYIYF